MGSGNPNNGLNLTDEERGLGDKPDELKEGQIEGHVLGEVDNRAHEVIVEFLTPSLNMSTGSNGIPIRSWESTKKKTLMKEQTLSMRRMKLKEEIEEEEVTLVNMKGWIGRFLQFLPGITTSNTFSILC